MMWISAISCSAPPPSVDATTALVDKFCNDVAAAFCEANWTCCLHAGEHFGQSVTDCKQKFGYPIVEFCNSIAYPDRAALEASLRAGTTIFDQTQFDTCLALFKSMTAGGSACVAPAGRVIMTSCLSAFQGQILPGEPCPWPDVDFADSVAQCKDGRCETGRCVPFLKNGDTCSTKKVWTDPALMICNYAHSEWCRSPLLDPDAGAGDAGDMGTCVPMGDIGDPCDPNKVNPGYADECKGWNCDATGKCALPDPYDTACRNY